MKIIYITSIITFLTFHFADAQQAGVKNSYPGIAVVELFTSQGDINCPPADKMLSEIITDAEKYNKPVYCISMHVDFWNRFGWKDPFSSMMYTRRLTNYTSILKEKETYTPYVIINGTKSVAGTDQKKVLSTIDSELKQPAVIFPEFSYVIFDDTLDITYDTHIKTVAGKSGSSYYANVVIMEKGLSTKVTKGDNEGKTLANDNVSRLFFTTDLKTSKGLIRVPLKQNKPGANKTILFFIQDKASRKVDGASAMNFIAR